MPWKPSMTDRLLPAARYHPAGLGYVFISFVILIGLLALAGWQFDIRILKRPIPQLVAMNPLTAVSFVIAGVSFLFLSFKKKSRQKLFTGYTLAVLVILISVIKIAGAAIPSFPKADHALFRKALKSDASENLVNSMAINTALGFIFSGVALLLLNYETAKKRVPAHFIAFIVFVFGFFSILGYLYRAPEFYDLLHYLPMAVHTAIGFLLLSLAIFFIHPDKGITKEIFSPFSGGVIGRVLIPVVIIIPIIFGALRLYSRRMDVFTSEFGTTLLVLGIVLVFCIIIIYNIILLNGKDFLRRVAEEKLRRSEEIFRSLVTSVSDYAIFMLDTNGNIVTWNKGAEAIKGYPADEAIGRHMSLFYTKEDLDKNLPQYILTKARENGRYEHEGWRIKKDGSLFWANAVITALYDKNMKITGFAKVTRDMTERKKARDLLSHFNEQLSKQVKEKTEEIEKTTEQLRLLTAHLQTAREEERKSIAREIHDELGQMLTGLRMDMVWLRKNIPAQEQAIATRFDKTMELLNDARQMMRRISTNLHPAVLEDLGLVTALGLQCVDFEKRYGIKVYFVSDLQGINDEAIDPDTKIGIYRVFQESLTNIIKHSDAKTVNTFLKIRDGNLVLAISDDGKGFIIEEAAGKKTLGLVSIRERAFMMNGNHEIHSIPGEGTTVLLTVPLNK